jgi:hypothetical protein
MYMSSVDDVAAHLADPQAGWAIGTFGAIGEFQRTADEAVVLSPQGAVTERGGIRLRVNGAVRIVAWERPASGDRWTQGIALCLPQEHGAMSARTQVTELGADAEALREQDREALLFDLGIGAPHCEFCVRSSDPEVVRALRSAVKQPLLAGGLLRDLAAMSPDRVIISRLGRVEVRTPIPAPGGKTLDGPHTHLLPDLLKHRRTHSATVPLPPAMVPSAELFPPKHAFPKLFEAYGEPGCIAAKRETIASVRAGEAPRDVPSYSRAQRLARRVALRQLAQLDGPSDALAAWRKTFDPEARRA